MAAVDASSFEVTPGRTQDFRAALREHKPWLERFGATVRAAQSTIAGELTGRVTLFAWYPNAGARGAALDRIRAAAAEDPILRVIDHVTPIAALKHRSLIRSLDPAEAIPVSTEVSWVTTYRPSAGERAAGESALLNSRVLVEGLGAAVIDWRLEQAGADAGYLGRAVGVATFAELARVQQSIGAAAPGPLARALEAGVLTRVHSLVLTAYRI